MAEIKKLLDRPTPRGLARKIRSHLDGSPRGDFQLDRSVIMMSVGTSDRLSLGIEHTLRVIDSDRPQHFPHGIVIVTFPISDLERTIVYETLDATDRAGSSFVRWSQSPDTPKGNTPMELYHKPDLQRYADLLDNTALKRIDRVDPSDPAYERLMGSRIKKRASYLFSLAVDAENARRAIDERVPVNARDFVANYQFGNIATRIRLIPTRNPLRQSHITIDFLPAEDALWEQYRFNRENIPVLRAAVVNGRAQYEHVPPNRIEDLAYILNHFDENDIF